MRDETVRLNDLMQEPGLFITDEEFQQCPSLFNVLERTLTREILKAEDKYEHYKGLHEIGEAKKRQIELMFDYEEKVGCLNWMLNGLKDYKKQYDKRFKKGV